MKLEAFFEKFDLFAGASGSLASIRKAILEFAVQGRLVPRKSSDIPAHTTFPRLVKFAVDAVSQEYPSHWLRIRLRDFGEWRGGGTPSKSRPDFWKGVIPWVSPKDMKTLWIEDSKDHISPEALEACSARLIPENSLLMVVRGMILAKAFPVAVTSRQVTINQDMKALLPHEPETTEFLLLVLRAIERAVLASIERSTHGTCKLETDKLQDFIVPLPPLSEQKRIVAKVDELMALCDTLEAQQKEREEKHTHLVRASLSRFADAPTSANLEFLFHKSYDVSPAELRKTILTLAVQGKLVPRIRTEETGAAILQDAGLETLADDEAPSIPSHWAWACLGELVTRMDSGWSPACSTEPAPTGKWGVLKTTAVQTLQYQEHENKLLPSNLKPRPEHEVMDGDILFTRAGPMNRVGILCVARPTRRNLMISDKIIRFHLIDGLFPDFTALAMNAGYSNLVIERQKSGMAASQVNISQPKLRSVPVPVPPLAEQRRIVAKVDELMALVDQLEEQLTHSRALAEKLLEALVAELTSGEMTNDKEQIKRSIEGRDLAKKKSAMNRSWVKTT